MAAAPLSEVASGGLHDLLIVTDATGSMSEYLRALTTALPDIIRISTLTNCFSRIGVLAYRDYHCRYDPDMKQLTQWSGWFAPGDADSGNTQPEGTISQHELIRFSRELTAGLGGGAEAAKTGLALAHSVMRSEATTFILFYADQTPHLPGYASQQAVDELIHLGQPDVYGGSGPLFRDWTSAAKTLASGEKKAQVFSLIDAQYLRILGPYVYLSTMTRGNCYALRGRGSDDIAAVSISILMGWMGLSKDGAAGDDTSGPPVAASYSYVNPGPVLKIADEHTDDFGRMVTGLFSGIIQRGHQLQTGIASSCETLSTVFTRNSNITVDYGRVPALPDLDKRYAVDSEYRTLVARQLLDIIETNVSAITTDPVFGTLWRAVASDRTSEHRETLTQAFGAHVEKLSDPAHRMKMRAWLEESYNFKAEIQNIILSVPYEKQYPCIFLDPTQDFSAMKDDNDARDPTQFTRGELLEIGRSCDYAILRRLGKVLTRLSYAVSEEEVPIYIREAPMEDVPRIPLALVEEQFGRQLWKALLHLILPGTKIAARPAALLAALSNRMGMLPLRDVADQELLAFSDKWNAIETPETWNLNCLSLLLDADRDYEKRVEEGITIRPEPNARVLSAEDRCLFQTLVDYKMLEINLGTTLEARIGWKPFKSKIALGPIVVCNKCRLPRSVTVMGPNGRCGVCQGVADCKRACCRTGPEHKALIKYNVSASDNELTEGTWFECSMSECRSQYVVYNVDGLKVRPKCHYCRHPSDKSSGKAPFVECVGCLSRVIWPVQYRPKNLDLATYKCTACSGGKTTIIVYETDARKLSNENGVAWLLRNEEEAIKEPFNGRSLFHTASNADRSTLSSRLSVLPEADTFKLTVQGKLVRNPEEVRATLADWVTLRRAELGSCALCFSDMQKAKLRSACGRKGCLSRICETCHGSWYGMNSRGKIINQAALCCPFCRRQPSPQAVPGELVRLGGLREAVADPGWIYAWCSGCGFAKQYMERVCANGAPAEVEGWKCEGCEERERREAAGGEAIAPLMKVMMCPGCDTATEKTSGCDHIECPCGECWCFECGKAVSSGLIYDHMSEAHGGWYGREGGQYDYEDYDTDEGY